MDLLNTKNGEKMGYICLMISPAVIGIVAVLMSFSTETGVDQKMIIAMLACFAISFYFTIQYKIDSDRKKKTDAFTADLQKDLIGVDTDTKKRK